MRKAVAGEALSTDQVRRLADVIARYTQTFLLWQRYDEGLRVAESVPKYGDMVIRPVMDMLVHSRDTTLASPFSISLHSFSI